MQSTARGEPRIRGTNHEYGNHEGHKGHEEGKEKKTDGRHSDQLPFQLLLTRFVFFPCVVRILRALRVLCGFSSRQLFVATSCNSAPCLARPALRCKGGTILGCTPIRRDSLHAAAAR